MLKQSSLNYGLLLEPDKSKVSVLEHSRVRMPLPLPLCLNSYRALSFAPSYSCSKFNFKSIPRDSYDLVLTGKEAVNFVILRHKLEKPLGYFVSDKVKIRLVFGVLNVLPIDTLYQRNSISLLEGFSIIKDAIKEMFKNVSYHEQGIEFIFSSEAIHILLKMINDIIAAQGKKGKKPQNIHIWMSFWPSEYDDSNNHDDDSQDDEYDNDDGDYK